MAIAVEGNSGGLDMSAATPSTTTTIPANATLAVILGTWWDDTESNVASATLDGQSVTQVINLTNTSAGLAGNYLGIVTGFSTGASKTFALTWSGGAARSEGGGFGIIFVSGASATPFDSDVDRDLSSTSSSITLTTQASDQLVIACAQNYAPDASDSAIGSTPSATVDILNFVNNSEDITIGHFVPDGTSETVTNGATQPGFGSICAVVLSADAGGGTEFQPAWGRGCNVVIQ